MRPAAAPIATAAASMQALAPCHALSRATSSNMADEGTTAGGQLHCYCARCAQSRPGVTSHAALEGDALRQAEAEAQHDLVGRNIPDGVHVHGRPLQGPPQVALSL